MRTVGAADGDPAQQPLAPQVDDVDGAGAGLGDEQPLGGVHGEAARDAQGARPLVGRAVAAATGRDDLDASGARVRAVGAAPAVEGEPGGSVHGRTRVRRGLRLGFPGETDPAFVEEGGGLVAAPQPLVRVGQDADRAVAVHQHTSGGSGTTTGSPGGGGGEP